MQSNTFISRIRRFIRQEYFEPDTSRALLATIALIVPVSVSHFVGKPFLGIFVGITAQLLTTAKYQGTYGRRAVIIGLGTLAISLASFISTLAGAYLLTALLFMAVVAFLASLARGLGDYGQTLGICAAILFLISLQGTHDLPTAWQRMQLVLLGGSWAACLLLFYWPISPNLPLFLEIAHPWEIGSSLMQLVSTQTIPGQANEDNFAKKDNNLRVTVTDVFALLKGGISGFSVIRRDLFKLTRVAYRFGVTAIAIRDEMEKLPLGAAPPALLQAIYQAVDVLAKTAALVADAIIRQRKKQYGLLRESVAQARQAFESLSANSHISTLPISNRLIVQHIFFLLKSSVTYLEDAVILLNRIEEKRTNKRKVRTIALRIDFRKRWQQFLLTVQPNSLLLKHSLRVMIVATAGLSLYYLLELPRGYWIVVTIMVLLQPDFSTTKEKTQNRLLGTLAGVIIGTLLLIYHLHFSFLIVAIAFCAFMFIYQLGRNYKIAVMFVTIMLVAMLEVAEAVSWYIAAYRLLATLIGGSMAIVAAYTLWPSWESMQFPSRMAKALRANKNYLLQIGHELQNRAGFDARVVSDQRKAEAENNNLADTVKRLIQEPEAIQEKVQHVQKLAYYNNKLTRELTSFAAFLPSLQADFDYSSAAGLIQELAQVMEELAAMIENKQPFSPQFDPQAIFGHMEVEIQEIRQQLQGRKDNIATLEDMLLNYELIYSLLEKIAEELKAMIELLNGEKNLLSMTAAPAI